MEKEKNQYEGFIYNSVIYLIAMTVGSCGALIGRTLLSFFVKTPNMAELKADGSFLFDVIYPLAGLFTAAGFIAAGFFCCYFVSYKIAYKTNKPTEVFKMKAQTVLPAVIMAVINTYMGFAQGFTGIFGMQFWYPAAWLSSLFKVIDKTNLLEYLTTGDITYSNFVLGCMKYRFNALTIVFAVILSAAFAISCYYGRRNGMEKGLKQKQEYLKTVRGS